MKTDKFIDAYIKIINESYSFVGPDMSDVNLSVKNDFNTEKDATKTDISDADTPDEKPIKPARKRKDVPYREASENFKKNYKIKLSYYVPVDYDEQELKEELEINDINELKGFYVKKYNESFKSYNKSMPFSELSKRSEDRYDQLDYDNRPNIDVGRISLKFISESGKEYEITTDNLWNFELDLKPWFEQHAEELEQLPEDKDIEIWWYVPNHYGSANQKLYTIKVRVLKK